MKRRLGLALVATCFLLPFRVAGAEMVLVEDGLSRAPIVLPADAMPETVTAAQALAAYIERMSGARPPVLTGAPEPPPGSAVWVGFQPRLAELFPEIDFDFQHPEEILVACDGKNLVIAGRDRVVLDRQVEFGTANAVYTFLQKYLEVRWFMPYPLWEDVPERKTIRVAETDYRFHPPFRLRKLYPGRPEGYEKFQRLLLGSYEFQGGHGSTDWWGKYGEAHPDFFAMLPSGKRVPHREPYETWGKDAKLCLSNPDVAAQWLDNAEAALREAPLRMMVSATPNDGPGFCTCENCRAMNHPDAPAGVLTDQHVKFWNTLARGLKERFPDREAWVGVAAYSSYREPPIAEVLEPNVAVSYVGHFPLANDEVTAREQAGWLGWAEMLSGMVFRPNLFHYSGGWLGLPTIPLRRTMRAFRFIADNKGVGLMVDTLPHIWATQGIQYYLMFQLAYDPGQDGEALLEDYHRRAFGPAAAEMTAYHDLLERADDVVLQGIRHSSGWAREAVAVYQRAYTPEVLAGADELMKQAEAKVAGGAETYRERVAFLRRGLDYIRLQVEIMGVMDRVRASEGKDVEAVKRSLELSAARLEMLKLPGLRFPEFYWNRVPDHLGPPADKYLEAAGLKEKQ